MNPIVCGGDPERMEVLLPRWTLAVFLSGELMRQTSQAGKSILSLGRQTDLIEEGFLLSGGRFQKASQAQENVVL